MNSSPLPPIPELTEGLLIVDDQGQIHYASPGAAVICERDRETLTELNLSDLDGQLQTQLNAVLAGQDVAESAVLAHSLATDQDRPVSARIEALEPGGNTRFAVLLTDQRTEEQRQRGLDEFNQRLQASNRDLEQFAYTVSHDLQAPLRTLTSFVRLLQAECGDEVSDDARQYLGFIDTGATQMQELISGLLQFSRASRVELEADPVNLDEVLKNALAQLHAAIQESGATIDIPEVLPWVKGNQSALIQLFQNLLGNAIKFRRDDQPCAITLSVRQGSDDKLTIGVHDNGVGIPEDMAQDVFELFRRLHSDNKRFPGSGMGLSICRKIVERHGGTISVQPNNQGGTTIRLELYKAEAP
jgi:signal transduction histidine kinase